MTYQDNRRVLHKAIGHTRQQETPSPTVAPPIGGADTPYGGSRP